MKGKVHERWGCSRYAVLLSTSALIACVSASAVAQEKAPDSSEEASESATQEIVVTGSRIRRPDLDGPSPISVLSADTIARKGTLSVQDAINEMPQLGIANGGKNQNFDSINSGYAVGGDYINLRNLGTQRTLVVVNGRRFIGGEPGTSSVDLNTIPSTMVDRIDVVTGAASAVYGADAVSGVVNVLLKQDYEGIKLTGHTGISKYSDAFEYQVGGIIGGKFADGRGGALLAAEHNQQNGFTGADRPFGHTDTNNFQVNNPAFGSAVVPNDVIAGANGTFTFDANNNLVLNSSLPLSVSRYQRLPTRSMWIPIKRTSVAASAHYDMIESDGGVSMTVYTEAMYSRSKSHVQYEDRAILFNGSPLLFTPLDSSLNAPRIPQNNPYAQALVPIIGPIPAAGLVVNSRLAELGRNATDINRETFRIVTGIRGDLGSKFIYDLYYQYGRLRVDQRDINAFSRARLAETLNVNDNGTPLNFADDFCANPIAVAQGCVPFNFLGVANGLNEPVRKYLIDPSSGVTATSKQQVVSGFISGDVFTLPAGPVGIVVGAEYRKEEAKIDVAQSYRDFTSSLRFQQGLPNTSYDVKEVFGEVNVPILANKPFFDKLEVGGAIRYSKYSTVGSEVAWNLRGEWQIVPEVRLRAVYSTAVRAPNLNELYSPAIALISTLVDPCATNTATPPTGTRAASCAADLGAAAATFTQTQLQSQTVLTVTQGDPNLDAEKAKTYTIGAVLRGPGSMRGLTGSIDYYHIQIDNVLSQLPTQDALNQCYDQASRPAIFCSLVNRDPTTGRLVSFANKTFNASTEALAGIDMRVNYQTPIDFLAANASLNLTAGWSHLIKHDFTPRAGAKVDHRKGQVGDFTNRFDVGVFVTAGQIGFNWQTRIYGKALADTTIAASSALNAANHIPSVAYHDMQVSFGQGNSPWSIAFGMKNVFDKKPPVITTPARTVTGVQPTVSSIYDTRGRFFYTTASIKF